MTGGEEYVRDYRAHQRREHGAQQHATAEEARQAAAAAQGAALLDAHGVALLDAVRRLGVAPSHAEYRLAGVGPFAQVVEAGRYWRVGRDAFLGPDGVLYAGWARPLDDGAFRHSPVPRPPRQSRKGPGDARQAARLAVAAGMRGAVENPRRLRAGAPRETANGSLTTQNRLVVRDGQLAHEESVEGCTRYEPVTFSLSWVDR